MRFSQVEVYKPIDLISIHGGKVQTLGTGLHKLQKIVTEGRSWHLLDGTETGAIDCHWTSCEAAGAIQLTRAAEDHDPRWYGIDLPLLTATNLEPVLLHATAIAHLIQGEILCNNCSIGRSMTYPTALAITPSHILPFSQDCHKCGQMLVQCRRNKRGPMMLFPKKVTVK